MENGHILLVLSCSFCFFCSPHSLFSLHFLLLLVFENEWSKNCDLYFLSELKIGTVLAVIVETASMVRDGKKHHKRWSTHFESANENSEIVREWNKKGFNGKIINQSNTYRSKFEIKFCVNLFSLLHRFVFIGMLCLFVCAFLFLFYFLSRFISFHFNFILSRVCVCAIYLQVKIVIFQIRVLEVLGKSCICGI